MEKKLGNKNVCRPSFVDNLVLFLSESSLEHTFLKFIKNAVFLVRWLIAYVYNEIRRV
jgi:hypothetical protein